MAERRVQVRDLRDAPTLRPQASPTQGFFVEQPKRVNKTGLTQVAEALQSVQPTIQDILGTAQEEATEEEVAEARRKFREAKKPLRKAIKDGDIRESQSPVFRRAWRQQNLRLEGQKFQSFLLEQYSKNPVKNSTDPEAALQFAQEKYKEFVDDNPTLQQADDIEMAEAFVPEADKAINGLHQQHVQRSAARIEKQARQNLSVEALTAVDDALSADPGAVMAQAEGARNVTEARYQVAARTIQSRLDSMIEDGMSGSDANGVVIESLAIQAEKFESPELMEEVLQRISTGSGTLAKTAKAREELNRIEDAVTSKQMRRWSFQQRVQDEQEQSAKQAQVDAFVQDRVSKIGSTESGQRANALQNMDPFDYIEENGITDPDVVQSILAMDSKLSKGTSRVVEDQEYISKLYQRMIQDPTSVDRQEIVSNIGDRYNTSRGTSILNDYETMAASTGDDGTAQHPLLETGAYQTLKNKFDNVLKPMIELGGTHELNATNAMVDFELSIREWLQKNPDVSRSEFIRHVRDEFNTISDYYAKTSGMDFSEALTSEQFFTGQNQSNTQAPQQPQSNLQGADTSQGNSEQSGDSQPFAGVPGGPHPGAGGSETSEEQEDEDPTASLPSAENVSRMSMRQLTDLASQIQDLTKGKPDLLADRRVRELLDVSEERWNELRQQQDAQAQENQ